MHGGEALDLEQLRTLTEHPVRSSSTKSLRSRSTIITFSARSFALERNASASSASRADDRRAAACP